jgi:hypothetical protein
MNSVLKKIRKSGKIMMMGRNRSRSRANESNGSARRAVRERRIHSDARSMQLVHLCVPEL